MKKEIGFKIIAFAERIFGIDRNEIDLESIEKLMIPKRYLENFEVTKMREKPNEWIIELTERKEKIPSKLQGKDIVLNGYKEKVEIIDHTFVGKIMYLQFCRRKWKIRGSTESYFNTYKLHEPGMKCTPEFGGFLKELPRQERHKFFCAFPNIRHIREEDF